MFVKTKKNKMVEIATEKIKELLDTFEKNTVNKSKLIIFHPSIKKELESAGCVFENDTITFEGSSFSFYENPFLKPNEVVVMDYTKRDEMIRSMLSFGNSVKNLNSALLQAGAAMSRMGDCFVTFQPELLQDEPTWWDVIKKFFKQLKSKINERFRTFKNQRRD